MGTKCSAYCSPSTSLAFFRCVSCLILILTDTVPAASGKEWRLQEGFSEQPQLERDSPTGFLFHHPLSTRPLVWPPGRHSSFNPYHRPHILYQDFYTSQGKRPARVCLCDNWHPIFPVWPLPFCELGQMWEVGKGLEIISAYTFQVLPDNLLLHQKSNTRH